MTEFRISLGLACMALLSACGGGGDNAPAAAATDNRANFETTAVKDTYVTFDWNLPTANVAPPTDGTDFFYSASNSAPASPSTGPQENIGVVRNLTSTLALPNLSHRSVDRVLKNGVIYARNDTHRQVWSYQGNNVLLTSYAADGVTPLYTTVADEWSAPIPLSGAIGNTTILKSFLGFAKLTTPLNLDFTKSWLTGSSYFTRKGYRQSNTLFVHDWTTVTYDANVTPYDGSETTIEAFFNGGNITIDSTSYAPSDGVISVIEGARTWVLKSRRPGFATDNYAALIELNGKIYFGNQQKAGTRFKYTDGVNSAVINDYLIRLNTTAADSIKQTVKF